MLAVVVAYHKNDNEDFLEKFERMLASIEFEGFEDNIFITLDGAAPDYIDGTIKKFSLKPQNVVFSTVNVGNYCLKFKLIDKIWPKFKYVKFCDFDDTSCSYQKMVKICELYKDSELIVCRTTRWSCFVNYWEKIFSMKLFTAIPKFECFTGGDVIIAWMSFYECFKYNWKFSFCGELIYYKTKEASRTCREKKPEEYLLLKTDSEEIKNILFYAETIESKHIYKKDSNILNIDFKALTKTINLNDFICHLGLHYKY